MPIRPSSSVSTFHLKAGFSQKRPDNVFFFSVNSFLMKVPMYCKTRSAFKKRRG